MKLQQLDANETVEHDLPPSHNPAAHPKAPPHHAPVHRTPPSDGHGQHDHTHDAEHDNKKEVGHPHDATQ